MSHFLRAFQHIDGGHAVEVADEAVVADVADNWKGDQPLPIFSGRA